jgi:hypothetical protein
MSAIRELEALFLAAKQDFPDLNESLERDFSYSVENALVSKIASLLEEAPLSEGTLTQIDSVPFDPQILQEFENAQDYVLQAILASSSTSAEVLLELVNRNPDWLTDGWWCIERLGGNPNCPSDLLERMVEQVIVNEDLELGEFLLEHPRLSESSRRKIEEFLD